MEKQNHQTEKRRKMLLAFPVLVLPFITLMFWALGGGANQVQSKQPDKGFNTDLPGAENKDDPKDKMGFYTEAEKNERELEKEQKRDPYYHFNLDSSAQVLEDPSPIIPDADAPDEKKVYQKLHALQKAINEPQVSNSSPMVNEIYDLPETKMAGDIDRLESMLHQVNQTGEEDPELKQVSELMESILDLQHPERVEQRLKKASQENRGNVYAVSGLPQTDPVSIIPLPGYEINHTGYIGNGFYGLDNIELGANAGNFAIKAVVHEDQVLVNGSVIKLRLAEPVYINGINIPKDQFVFGVVKLSGERLAIEINSLRYGNRLFPVELHVYDMDGLAGIFIPGAISRDVAKQGGERAIQGFGITSLDPSLGAQAASAGMEITRNLLSKKVKLVKVAVKAGYQVLLVDVKQNKSR